MVNGIWSRIKIKNEKGQTVEAIAPVIVSASRATDIPAFYADWFMERLRKGFVKWKNPFSGREQYVSFDKTRLVVFWTKDPRPLIPRLKEIGAMGINYYFQYTLNDYALDGLEPNVPPLEERIRTFKELSGAIGRERVIWRFDPLVLTDGICIDSLVEKVVRVGETLRRNTRKLVFSFADIAKYRKVRNNLKTHGLNYIEWDAGKMRMFARKLHEAISNWDLEIATCAEETDLSRYGIGHNSCIDPGLIMRVFGSDHKLSDFIKKGLEKKGGLKDKGQRKHCGCIASKDIGSYNTCGHMCRYCYANSTGARIYPI